MELRGWEQADVVLFSGDAYVDHPSFGAAVAGRLLEACGMKVALVPQPDWRGDHRDFTKMGKPRYFFAISAGCMDSMVNRYTANKRLRSDDAYTADGLPGARPDYTTITYANILKKLYPEVPIVIGGIEASMRRLSHYDYWSDRLMPGILVDSKADLLVYGMGEKPLKEIAGLLLSGAPFDALRELRQVAYLRQADDTTGKEISSRIQLHSHEECLNSKRKQAENFRVIEEESNKMEASVLIQRVGEMEIVVNPPHPPLSSEELDASFELPYTRLSLNGTIIVGRDIAHAKLKERLDEGKGLPQYIKDHPIYYAGPAKRPQSLPSGSFGPTTAGRMDSYVELFQRNGGSMVMIAKGNRSRQVTEACQKYGGFYLGSIGGPAAILAEQNIKSVECLEYPELGMEAIWKIEVENFPAFILVDDKGNDFFEQIKPACLNC